MMKRVNLNFAAVTVLIVLMGTGSALAEPIVRPGYYAEPYITNLTNVSDIAFSPGGDFGYEGQLFVLDSRPNAKIYRIPEKGEKIFFANIPNSRVMSTSLDFAPIGSEFGPYLFVTIEHRLYKYGSDGIVKDFANINVFPWCIEFAPDERFRNNLFLADGWEPSREAVREFRSNGTQDVLVHTDREETVGLTFGPGGPFGSDLYVLFQKQGRNGYKPATISRVTPEGVMTDFLVFADYEDTVALAFDTTGNFNGNLFVCEYGSDSILEINPEGDISEFASGFAFSAYSDYAPHLSSRIVFGPDGAMYVSDGGEGIVWRIAPVLGELESLEITGPDEVVENSSAQYTAKAHYAGGTVVNITNSVRWNVDPNSICQISNSGKLTAGDISMPTEQVMISTEYTHGDRTVGAHKNVDIFSICPSGSALEFDGINDYVDCGNNQSLDLGGKSFAVMAWVKTTDVHGGCVTKHNGSQNGEWYHALHEGRFAFGGSQAGKYRHSDAKVNDGRWHHLVGVVVHNGTNDNDLYQYIDGHLDGSLQNIADILSGQRHLLIGDENNRLYQFGGMVDEVCIYDRALSAEEIQFLMHNRPDVDDPSLVGYWNFDEGDGQVAYDASGNDNDGHLGATPENPDWVESDAPVGICSYYIMAKHRIKAAKKLKQDALELIAKAIENEILAQDILRQMLESGEYENLKKGDVVKAKQEIHTAIQHEEQAEDTLEKSVENLDNAVDSLTVEEEPVELILTSVEFWPKAINLNSQRKWLGCVVTLGDGYDVGDVDTESIYINGRIKPLIVRKNEQRQDLIAVFDISLIWDMLGPNSAEFVVNGAFVDGSVFGVSGVVEVMK